ncbi:hypothetical protein DPV78_007257 [Talaromyces pinophilus]|nr:hypothetical protein DPV78_007257 [Talaromyces pinophilus]
MAPIGGPYKSDAYQVQRAGPITISLSETGPMDCNTDFVFFRVSKSKGVATSARKYRDLRLEALKASPASFSSTYETEAAFTDDEWVGILTSLGRETFICAAITCQDNVGGLAKWVGQVTLRAPCSPECSAQSMDPGNDNER